MRKIHKLLLPAIIFMMAIIQVKAQGTAGIDVIPNGGFEKWQDTGQPTGWRIVSSLNPERVQERRPESTGVYALKIWLNGGSVFLAQPVSVKAGKQYTLSFWNKGSVGNREIVGVNLAVSFSCIVGCPICKIYLVDHGYRKFKEKIHFMEQYR